MSKAPRDKDSATPRKRTRKAAATTSGNGIHADHGNGAVERSVIGAAESANGRQLSPSLEDRIRVRAYELYLQRGSNGGSPEQDWFRAQEEICGRHSVA
jgi:hypothetical protein